MTAPKSFDRRNALTQKPIQANGAIGLGNGSAPLYSRDWLAEPRRYDARLRAILAPGTSEAVSISHVFYVDDGIDGEKEYILTTSMDNAAGDEDFLLVSSCAAFLTIRVESFMNQATVTGRGCSCSALVAERA